MTTTSTNASQPPATAGAPGAADPQAFLDLDERWCAHNYHPLPVVISAAEGAWVTDVAGRRYLDMLAGYSALNFGHRHPDLIAAAVEQLGLVTLTSRAFHHDQLGPFCEELADLTGTEMVLPMNSGAEAVESAIKVARKWAYQVKKVPENQAQIITANGNFHGRTLTIVSFSDDSVAHDDYGPYTPGFLTVKYGDLEAIAGAITPNTAAILLEPIQGEAGVVVPPAGYLAGVRKLCDDNNVLFIADEIQSGLGRTGETLALDHDGVRAEGCDGGTEDERRLPVFRDAPQGQVDDVSRLRQPRDRLRQRPAVLTGLVVEPGAQLHHGARSLPEHEAGDEGGVVDQLSLLDLSRQQVVRRRHISTSQPRVR